MKSALDELMWGGHLFDDYSLMTPPQLLAAVLTNDYGHDSCHHQNPSSLRSGSLVLWF